MKYFLILLLLASGMVYGQLTDKEKELLGKAMIAEDSGDLDGAIKWHFEVLKINPNRVESMNVIAGLYGLQGNFKEEINWAKKAIGIDPKFSLAYINLGSAYGEIGDLKNAEASFKKAELFDQSSPYPSYSLGVMEENKKNYQAAIVFYKRSLARDHKFADAYYNLAAVYANLKDFENANKSILKVLELEPDSKDAQDMHKRILKAMQKQ